MFSSRTQWNTSLNNLSDLLAKKLHQGISIIDLTESNPTRCGFSYPAHEILAALANESALSYQPDSRGLLSARRAIAEQYARSGRTVSPEQIVLTASTSEAYSFLFKLLCDAGDEVIIPRQAIHCWNIFAGSTMSDFGSIDLRTMVNGTSISIRCKPNSPRGPGRSFLFTQIIPPAHFSSRMNSIR